MPRTLPSPGYAPAVAPECITTLPYTCNPRYTCIRCQWYSHALSTFPSRNLQSSCMCAPHDVSLATRAGIMARTHGKRCGHGRGQLPARLAAVLRIARRSPGRQCPHQRPQQNFPGCQSLRSHQLKQLTVLQHTCRAISTAKTLHATFRWRRELWFFAVKSLSASQQTASTKQVRLSHNHSVPFQPASSVPYL